MLIKFESVEIKYFKSIKNSVIQLLDRGVVLVNGVNNDKQGSNGSGKSTMINALLWCLYGKTLNGKESDKDIVSAFIPKKQGTSVSTRLFRDTEEFIITRYRKHPNFKNNVIVKQVINGKKKDKSKATDGDTDIFIEKIVGADYASFVFCNVFSFDSLKPFLSKNDKEKKELIIPKYLIDTFKEMYKLCLNDIKDLEHKLLIIEKDLVAYDVKVSEKISRIKEIDEEIETRDNRRKNIKTSIKEKLDIKNDLKDNLVKHTIPNLKSQEERVRNNNTAI
jgi:DNA repair exonuclease SbcCD ATPase subunit